ncbi:MAG: pseudouridine synthase [Vicingaceae bacterium]
MLTHFTPFKTDISENELPKKFTFPFYYKPHPLSIVAVKELQKYLSNQTGWDNKFGLNSNSDEEAIGKMFGVLVVQNSKGKLGYISAVSGKLFDSNKNEKFIPPVFDMNAVDSFFNDGIKKVNQLINEINQLENQNDYISNLKQLEELQNAMNLDLADARKRNTAYKKERDEIRNEAKFTLFGEEFTQLCTKLKQESANKKFYLTHLTEHWDEKLNRIKEKTTPITNKINALKNERQKLSANLQQQLFEAYSFLNAKGETRGLIEIFKDTALQRPPAAAGECAAPKLLHFAYKHHLKPIAIAEFWWGKSPKSEIRKHKNFYPACQGKCKPILGHMLQGLEVDENPMLKKPEKNLEIKIVFEDENMVVINKPEGLLSVPGVNIKDSVALRMKTKYPKATGPLTVHRLDMQTSGIMLIAKSLAIHKNLQKQFMDRTIKKRYIALLDGIVDKNNGVIDLPLRPDYDDRPRQLVCYEHGKHALTNFEVIERKNKQTRIYFYPVTGRTHQLRVHSAHHKGLNIPILGDDMYGKPAERLFLHAQFIQFKHPVTGKKMKIEVDPEF